MQPAEGRFVAIGCNRTATAIYEPYVTVHAAFVAAAAANPRVVALRADDGAELTYAALDERSDVLVAALCERAPDRRLVALVFERSFAMIVSIFGVLKAGGGYLPIEPAYPAERVSHMLEEASPVVALTDGADHPATSALHAAAITLHVYIALASGVITPISGAEVPLPHMIPSLERALDPVNQRDSTTAKSVPDALLRSCASDVLCTPAHVEPVTAQSASPLLVRSPHARCGLG